MDACHLSTCVGEERLQWIQGQSVLHEILGQSWPKQDPVLKHSLYKKPITKGKITKPT